MPVDHRATIALTLALLGGCTFGAPSDEYAYSTQAALERPDHETPVDDWQRHERASFVSNGRRYGDYYTGTICFPFGDEGAMCGGDETVTVSEGQSETMELAGSFEPPELGIEFSVSSSTTHSASTTVTFRGRDCDYCWPFVCYTMTVEPYEYKVNPRHRTWHQARSPRVTYDDPSIRRLCYDADVECGCVDAGAADAGSSSSATDSGASSSTDAGAGADAG